MATIGEVVDQVLDGVAGSGVAGVVDVRLEIVERPKGLTIKVYAGEVYVLWARPTADGRVAGLAVDGSDVELASVAWLTDSWLRGL